jgi:hypothetical protein
MLKNGVKNNKQRISNGKVIVEIKDDVVTVTKGDRTAEIVFTDKEKL